jgi:hypothetical protein
VGANESTPCNSVCVSTCSIYEFGSNKSQCLTGKSRPTRPGRASTYLHGIWRHHANRFYGNRSSHDLAGSLTSQGTVRLQTRRTNQTSIKFQTSSDNWSIVYSNGQANKINETGTTVLPLELSSSSQCMYFPFPFLASLLNNPDVSIQYVGQEALDSSVANHIRVLNTFNSATQMQFLSDFTLADIWLDSTSA